MYPATIVSSVLLVFLLLLIPKRYLLLPFVLAACFVPTDQRVIIFDLDFTPLRILVVVGVLRLLLRGELRSISWNRFDKLVLSWALVGAIIYVTQWRDMRALIYKCGVLFDIIGLYWLFRQSIRSWSDIAFPFTVLAICGLVLGMFVAYERATGRNLFAVFGQVNMAHREGRLRCAASFPHSIMLGLFWATIFPVFVGLSLAKRRKYLYWAAAAVSVFIIFATRSSTPISTWLIVLIVLCGYKWRRYVGCASWGLLGLLIALHIVMEAPVWHLISRVRIIGGSTGWHRYILIDSAIRHFSEWALIGCRSTAHWGWGLGDVTNQYIVEGVRGGFVSLVLFAVMVFMACKTLLGLSISCQEPKRRFLAWCLFVTMIGHCVAFLGVSYFGQINMLWYMTLAMVGFLSKGHKCEEYAATINLLPNWINAAG